MENLLEVKNLVKHFGAVKAVNGVSFSIPRGKCFGLLGPNGAGKTTTVEMIEGVKEPDTGEIWFKGERIGREFKEAVGIQFQNTALQDYLKVKEALALFHQFYEKPKSTDEVIRLCHLEELLDRDCRKLSGGQRQRLLLGIALINDPEILFLDEPTTGLDPQARRGFWDLINDIKREGRTVVLTTHYMEEAYVLCDEIIIIDHGKIISQGPPDKLLKERFEGSYVRVSEAHFRETYPDLIAGSVLRDGYIEIETKDVSATLKMLLDVGMNLETLNVRSSDLEDLFLDLTGKDLR